MIDLQIEEAPLILKKGIGPDKCVSCNQVVHTEHLSPVQNVMRYNEYPDSYRTKLKNYQDVSNKLGVGYSKLLSYCQADTFVDESASSKSRKNAHSVNISVHLPQISTIEAKKGGNMNTSTNINSISINGEKLNTLIVGELDRKGLKGESLIKAADKLYNEIAKDKKN